MTEGQGERQTELPILPLLTWKLDKYVVAKVEGACGMKQVRTREA